MSFSPAGALSELDPERRKFRVSWFLNGDVFVTVHFSQFADFAGGYRFEFGRTLQCLPLHLSSLARLAGLESTGDVARRSDFQPTTCGRRRDLLIRRGVDHALSFARPDQRRPAEDRFHVLVGPSRDKPVTVFAGEFLHAVIGRPVLSSEEPETDHRPALAVAVFAAGSRFEMLGDMLVGVVLHRHAVGVVAGLVVRPRQQFRVEVRAGLDRDPAGCFAGHATTSNI
uniref:Uncharacterized protein n=1 Tax=uncultured marine virus TaxID=186617 RepID=A0A0F7LAG3_9VIRU|nr:hypothetical protein [uncultured marine virus]